MTSMYRKKPIVIEAIQFVKTEESGALIRDWILSYENATVTYHVGREEIWASNGELAQFADPEHLRIRTLEGTMRADVGDWIIKGVMGEFYPCKPDIFAATYDAVNE